MFRERQESRERQTISTRISKYVRSSAPNVQACSTSRFESGRSHSGSREPVGQQRCKHAVTGDPIPDLQTWFFNQVKIHFHDIYAILLDALSISFLFYQPITLSSYNFRAQKYSLLSSSRTMVKKNLYTATAVSFEAELLKILCSTSQQQSLLCNQKFTCCRNKKSFNRE